MIRLDLAGQRFGRLLVLGKSHMKKNTYYKCLCDCGNMTTVVSHLLRSGKARSCGCLRKEVTSDKSRIDISGKKYGRLLVSNYAFTLHRHRTYWKCICDCGRVVNVSKTNLMSGNTTSCGCFRDEFIRVRFLRENNPMWQGGMSGVPYPIGWNKRLRKAIRERDNHECKRCGAKEISRKFDVHHIDFDKNNVAASNLITLCSPCHTMTRFDKPYWAKILAEKVVTD